VHPDVEALLAVQSEDAGIRTVEKKLAAMKPRLDALESERAGAATALERAKARVEAEEKRLREVSGRVEQHRQLVARNQSQLEHITSPREAAAAMAQMEQANRMIADAERELAEANDAIGGARHEIAERERELAEVESRQSETRTALEGERAQLQGEIAELRKRRDGVAVKVPRALLSRYDRIQQNRKVDVLHPLRGVSCSHCDTAIPVQRRSGLVSGGKVELCEGCGMLLYAAD
jgi:uncharacterized protein